MTFSIPVERTESKASAVAAPPSGAWLSPRRTVRPSAGSSGFKLNPVEGAVIHFVQALAGLPRVARVILVGGLGLGGLVTNWWAGPATSLVLVYSIVVALTAWLFSSPWPALAMSVALAAASGLLIVFAPDNTTEASIVWINSAFRTASLCLLATVVSALHRHVTMTERVALVDALTGVESRHAILFELQIAADQAQRNATSTSVVYFDLDGLKSVNDTRGHAAGDALIRSFADLVGRRARPGDQLGRLGGDEFLLVCRDTTAAEAEQLVREIVAGPDVPGVSWGIATTSGAIDPLELVAVADQAMYRQKRARLASRA